MFQYLDSTSRERNEVKMDPPPRNPTDQEQRRRAWCMCLMFDRMVGVGGWPHSIDERDAGTEFPLWRVDFGAEVRYGPTARLAAVLMTLKDPRHPIQPPRPRQRKLVYST